MVKRKHKSGNFPTFRNFVWAIVHCTVGDTTETSAALMRLAVSWSNFAAWINEIMEQTV